MICHEILWKEEEEDFVQKSTEISFELTLSNDPAISECFSDSLKIYEDELERDIIRLKKSLSNFSKSSLTRARKKLYFHLKDIEKMFMTRAALKLAEIDAFFDFRLSIPSTKGVNNPDGIENFEIFYFEDLCACTGGFSEYLCWRKQDCFFKGFAITLREENVVEPELSKLTYMDAVDVHYGVGGCLGDGDITSVENIKCFTEYVSSLTSFEGVHLVVSDGAFDCTGREGIQEPLTHQLNLCEEIISLLTLRNGGNFVMKFFETVTISSYALIFLVVHLFQRCYLCKPESSRPTNSEKYLVCFGYKSNKDVALKLLMLYENQLKELNVSPGQNVFLITLISVESIIQNRNFMQSMKIANKSFHVKLKYHLEILVNYLNGIENPFPIDDFSRKSKETEYIFRNNLQNLSKSFYSFSSWDHDLSNVIEQIFTKSFRIELIKSSAYKGGNDEFHSLLLILKPERLYVFKLPFDYIDMSNPVNWCPLETSFLSFANLPARTLLVVSRQISFNNLELLSDNMKPDEITVSDIILFKSRVIHPFSEHKRRKFLEKFIESVNRSHDSRFVKISLIASTYPSLPK